MSLCLYLVPFLRYSVSNNGVTLKFWFEITQSIQNGTIRKLGYGFLFEFYSNYTIQFIEIYGSTSYRFPDKAEYLAKNRNFLTPPLHSTTPLAGSQWDYCHSVWYGKTRLVWLPGGETCLMISLAVSTEYRRVTDRQTDRRTDILLQYSSRYTWRRAVETDN